MKLENDTSMKQAQKPTVFPGVCAVKGRCNEAVHHLHHNNSVRAYIYQEMVVQWIMNPCRDVTWVILWKTLFLTPKQHKRTMPDFRRAKKKIIHKSSRNSGRTGYTFIISVIYSSGMYIYFFILLAHSTEFIMKNNKTSNDTRYLYNIISLQI